MGNICWGETVFFYTVERKEKKVRSRTRSGREILAVSL